MPELHLQRIGDNLTILTITLGDVSASIPWSDIAPDETTGQRIYFDAVAYGRDLFDKTFRDEPLRTALSNLRTNERLVLVAADQSIASIPWEYLREPDGRLLATRLTLVRSVPEARPNPDLDFTKPLHIVAIPVSPVNDSRPLDTEGEWQRVVNAVSKPGKALTVTRVRPPTLTQTERTLNPERTTIVHFMGHSDSKNGNGLLAFEESHGRSYLVKAVDFADALAATNIYLVVLTSCLSARAWDWTSFGNIAGGLVREGIPYALGMQFKLPDEAALELSSALYDFLLQGRSVEEAVRRTRRALEHSTTLHNPAWVAGLPVLYTSQREHPVAPLSLSEGKLTIQPDPEQMQKTYDMTALPQAAHFVGREKEIGAVMDALLAANPGDFVVLHGLGGIGKTALARAIAERLSYHYRDRGLAISFETFASLDTQNQRTINEQFADRFYNRLARFYELDPAQYPTTLDLQQAILQRHKHTRSLLVLDNIETLIDAQKSEQPHPAAKALATFISRLKEGDGDILLTSRIEPPSDWGRWEVIRVPGLTEEAGADLFQSLLPTNRLPAALEAARLALSKRVQGHPLSIRLLAGRFAETTNALSAFLQDIDAELSAAEQTTPTSLEDPNRQATLYACMAYSINRLTPEQLKVLHTVSIFKTPFPPEFAESILENKEQTQIHLQSLVRLGLLDSSIITLKEGSLELLDLHPMVRWYIQHHLPKLEPELLERYGLVYEQLARQSYQPEGGYDQSSLMRYLVRQSLPDFEAAFDYLPPAGKSSLAYHLSEPYERLGQPRRALALYERALEINQELGDVRGVAVTQNAMADVLRQLGKPQEALALYEQSLRTKQELGDMHGVAVTQNAMARVLSLLGKLQEALALFEQAMHTMQELGDVRGVALTQNAMAIVLSHLGKPQEALALYEQAMHTMQELSDVRGMAATQYAMADVLRQLGKPQEALALYEQALYTDQELGEVRGVAVTQNAMADVLRQLGKPQEALALYEQALHTKQELGEVREVAVTQNAMAGVLRQLGKPQEALVLYERALCTMQELGDMREVTVTQNAMASLLRQLGKLEEAQALYEQALQAVQDLGEVQGRAIIQMNFGQLLFQQNEHRRALAMVWQAYISLNQRNYIPDAQATQQILISMKQRLVEQTDFDELWNEVIKEPQPDWLRNVQASASSEQSRISSEQLRVIVANTITVMIDMREKLAEWRKAMNEALQRRQSGNLLQEAEFFAAILAILDGQTPTLLEDHPYAGELAEIQAGIATGGTKDKGISVDVSNEIMQAVRDFVNAKDWGATRQVVEAQQALLFQPEVETLFEQNIAQAKAKEEMRTAQILEQHLTILRDCKINGIAATFEQLIAAQEDGQDDLPFDAELIPRSIAALLGSPQEKMAYAQDLMQQATQTTDEDLKALFNTIQMALFGGDLSQHGQNLNGVYRQAWEAIVLGVETGGVDPQLLEAIVNNTLAVLGPAVAQLSKWRGNLVDIRNSALAKGTRHLVTLLDAIIALLDAGGNPAGLGQGLEGIYAQIWQAIVQHLPKDQK